MFLVWIAGAWLGANVAVVAMLVALSERGRRRPSALPPTTATQASARPRAPTTPRVVAFAFLTPFFFLKGGMVSLGDVASNLGVLAANRGEDGAEAVGRLTRPSSHPDSRSAQPVGGQRSAR